MTEAAPMRWWSGDAHALVWRDGAALVPADLALSAVTALWESQSDAPSVAGFLSALGTSAGTGLLDLPDFSFVVVTAEEVHLASRGGLPVIVTRTSGDVDLVSGRGVTTWAERVLPKDSVAQISLGEVGDDPARPVVGGVLPASGLQWQLAPMPVETVPAEVEDVEAAVAESPEEDAPEQEARVEETPAEEAPVEEMAVEEVADEEEVVDEEEVADEEVAEDPEPELSPPLPPRRFASMWAENTIQHSVEEAAVRPTEADASEPASPASVPETEPDVAEPPAEPVATEPVVADPVAAVPAADGTQQWVEPVAADGELLARVCANGHANPPARETCRVCAAQLTGSPYAVDRPVVGRILVSDGQVADLVGSVVIGRNPRASQVHGATLPQLLVVTDEHVSATHLEVIVDDWRVIAVDRNSTNGSFLVRGGSRRRFTSVAEPLLSGDLVELGDGHGVTLTFAELP